MPDANNINFTIVDGSSVSIWGGEAAPAPKPPADPLEKLTLTATRCCGMLELNNISMAPDSETIIRKFRQWWLITKPTFVIFTGITKRVKLKECYVHPSLRMDDYGQALSDYLTTNGFGEVTRSPERVNGSTQNTIRVWVWAPDYDSPTFKALLDKGELR